MVKRLKWSSILAEVVCELNLPLKICLGNWRLNASYSLEEVLCCDVGSFQLRGFNLVETHIYTIRVWRKSWLKETILSATEPGGCLASTNGHHHGLLNDDGHIRSWITFGSSTQLEVVLLREVVGSLSETNLELDYSGVGFWKGDINTLLEATSDCGVELPRNVWCAQDEDSVVVISNTLHLHKELSLDSARCLIFSLTTTAA